MNRLLADCRDLWRLLTGSHEPHDALATYRVLADMAKTPVENINWFAWQMSQFRTVPSAFWNDPWLFDTRYVPTPADRLENFTACKAEWASKIGLAEVERIVAHRLDRHKDMLAADEGFRRSPDPVGFALNLAD